MNLYGGKALTQETLGWFAIYVVYRFYNFTIELLVNLHIGFLLCLSSRELKETVQIVALCSLWPDTKHCLDDGMICIDIASVLHSAGDVRLYDRLVDWTEVECEVRQYIMSSSFRLNCVRSVIITPYYTTKRILGDRDPSLQASVFGDVQKRREGRARAGAGCLGCVHGR